jgi:hypothetical protein
LALGFKWLVEVEPGLPQTQSAQPVHHQVPEPCFKVATDRREAQGQGCLLLGQIQLSQPQAAALVEDSRFLQQLDLRGAQEGLALELG